MRSQARLLAVERAIEALEREVESYAAGTDLLPVRQTAAATWVKTLEDFNNRLGEDVAQRQTREAQDEAGRAQTMKELAENAFLIDLIERYKALAEEGQTLPAKDDEARENLSKVTELKDELQKTFDRVKDRVEAGGHSQAIGLLLRKERADRIDVSVHRSQIRRRLPDMRETQVRIFVLNDRRDDLVADMEDEVAYWMDQATAASMAANEPELKSAVRAILDREGEYLESIIPRYDTYFDTLSKLDYQQGELIDLAVAYRRYIDEHILWIHSMDSSSNNVAETAAWLVSPKNWRETVGFLWSGARVNVPITIVAAIGLVLLLRFQRLLRHRIGAAGRRHREEEGPSLGATVQAAIYTVCVAAVWPALVVLVGWRLAGPLEAPHFAKSIGLGLLATSSLFFLCELPRQMCRPHGLAQAHFGWPAELVSYVRRLLRPVILALLPLVFIVFATEAHAGFMGSDSLGRAAFVAFCLIASWASHLVLRHGGPVVAALEEDASRRWLPRARRPLHLLAVAFPLALAALAVAGYYYTALNLAIKSHTTAWFFLLMLLLTLFVRRWLHVSQQRLPQYEPQQSDEGASLFEGTVPANEAQPAAPSEDEEEETEEIHGQALRILGGLAIVALVVGLYRIWNDVMPALGLFQEFSIGAENTITPAKIALSIVIVALTLIAARNMPGVLEILFLRRLPIDRGSRYAITTVARYAIAVVGVVVLAWVLRIGWSKVQWLAAALAVGLGFGLQEIFANFVSGLILLIERPVRVGDTVTIGDVNGTVMKIQMRATTVQDWNRRELIVPNKELITGKLVNWTLSDASFRIDLKIGIAYGSDTALARQILLDVARQHPDVLRKPAPKAIFRGFGESALDFELRAYIPDINYWPRAITELNMLIDRRLRDNGIEIAFPQRDIHVRSIDGQLSVAPDQSRVPVSMGEHGGNHDVA